MAEPDSVKWQGASGRQYTYWIYPIPARFNAGQDGNYIYSKLKNEIWVPLYIGQGDLSDRADIDNHHQSTCLKSKGATHFHAHKNSRKADRTAEERDLLAGHPEAYKPTGCNDKPGG